MARRNPWFSFESDNDEIDLEQDVTGTVTELDETAVDEAGEDSKTTDVTPSKEETAHNEVASAGGVATGNNTEQLEMDPVAASEAWIRKTFGLSREDMEESVDEVVAKAETIPDASEANLTGDPDLDNTACDPDNGTTVNITSPSETHIDINAAGDEVEVGSDTELDSTPETEEDENMSASDVAALEGLRRLWSREDDDMSGGDGNPDVELDVKTSSQDTNLEFEGKAVTIEPNDDAGSDSGSDDYGSSDDGGYDSGSDDDYGASSDDEGGYDEGSSDEGEEKKEEEKKEDEEEGGEETSEGFYFW